MKAILSIFKVVSQVLSGEDQHHFSIIRDEEPQKNLLTIKDYANPGERGKTYQIERVEFYRGRREYELFLENDRSILFSIQRITYFEYYMT